MHEKIIRESLEILRAVQVIGKYQAKKDSRIDKDVVALIDTLLDVAERDHKCPKCGEKLELYIFN